jgi:hypothetical protein
VPNNIILSQRLNVFLLDSWSAFAVLQSRCHEIWALFFGSTLEDRPVYTPSDCFETFPFPNNWDQNPRLEQIAAEYYQFRGDSMIRAQQGLTDTYNRFHNKAETDPDVFKLRDLHEKMDRAVLDAYGWTDFQPRLDFILDYREDEVEDDSAGSDRKKPWRYRWVDEDRDEVLARLLELNRAYAEGGAQKVPVVPAAQTSLNRRKGPTKIAPVTNRNLFEVQEPTE